MTTQFLSALLTTFLVESIVSILFLRKKIKKDWSYFFQLNLLISGATLPYLWFVLPFLFLKWRPITMEVIIIAVETLLWVKLTKLSWKRSLLVSFLTNAVSYVLGLLLF
mgnify:CR=1 FL=1